MEMRKMSRKTSNPHYIKDTKSKENQVMNKNQLNITIELDLGTGLTLTIHDQVICFQRNSTKLSKFNEFMTDFFRKRSLINPQNSNRYQMKCSCGKSYLSVTNRRINNYWNDLKQMCDFKQIKQEMAALINFLIKFKKINKSETPKILERFQLACQCGEKFVFWLENQNLLIKAKNISQNQSQDHLRCIDLLINQLSSMLGGQTNLNAVSDLVYQIWCEIKTKDSYQDTITELIRSKSIIKSLQVHKNTKVIGLNDKKMILQKSNKENSQQSLRRFYYTETKKQKSKIVFQDKKNNKGRSSQTKTEQSKKEILQVKNNIKTKRKSLCLDSNSKYRKKSEFSPFCFHLKNRPIEFDKTKEQFIINELSKSKDLTFYELFPSNKNCNNTTTTYESDKKAIKQIYQQILQKFGNPIQNLSQQKQAKKQSSQNHIKKQKHQPIDDNHKENFHRKTKNTFLINLKEQLNREINPIGEQIPKIRKLLLQKRQNCQFALYLLSKQFFYLRTSFYETISNLHSTDQKQCQQQIQQKEQFKQFLKNISYENLQILKNLEQMYQKILGKKQKYQAKANFNGQILSIIMKDDDTVYTEFIQNLVIANFQKYSYLFDEIRTVEQKTNIESVYRYGLAIILAIRGQLSEIQSESEFRTRIQDMAMIGKEPTKEDLIRQFDLLKQILSVFH